ncbi:multicopper oxidase domain-containing protein [Oerskovia sp. M15]
MLRSFPQDLGANAFTARFAGGDDTLDVLELRAADRLTPSAPVPASLASLPAADAASASVTRRFELSGTTINGQNMDLRRIDEVVDAGATEVWEVTSLDDAPHNFHVHDAQFQVLDVSANRHPSSSKGGRTPSTCTREGHPAPGHIRHHARRRASLHVPLPPAPPRGPGDDGAVRGRRPGGSSRYGGTSRPGDALPG